MSERVDVGRSRPTPLNAIRSYVLEPRFLVPSLLAIFTLVLMFLLLPHMPKAVAGVNAPPAHSHDVRVAAETSTLPGLGTSSRR